MDDLTSFCRVKILNIMILSHHTRSSQKPKGGRNSPQEPDGCDSSLILLSTFMFSLSPYLSDYQLSLLSALRVPVSSHCGYDNQIMKFIRIVYKVREHWFR